MPTINKEKLEECKKTATIYDTFYGIYALTLAYIFNRELYNISHDVLQALTQEEE